LPFFGRPRALRCRRVKGFAAVLTEVGDGDWATKEDLEEGLAGLDDVIVGSGVGQVEDAADEKADEDGDDDNED
jgi:hypothetical protein